MRRFSSINALVIEHLLVSFVALVSLVPLALVSLVPHVSLAALPSLGDCVGFGVGDPVGVGVRLLRLPHSLFSHISVCDAKTRFVCVFRSALRGLEIASLSNPPSLMRPRHQVAFRRRLVDVRLVDLLRELHCN